MGAVEESRFWVRRERTAPVPEQGSTGRRGLPVIAAVFLIGLTIPLVLEVGTLRLSINRLVLLLTVLPCLILWIGGRAGRMLLADFCILGIWAWSALSFLVLHSPAAVIESIGIDFVELVGAWFLARCFIRTPEAFHGMVRLLWLLVMALLPLGVWEALTAHNITLDLFAKLGPVIGDVPKEPRWGLDRVQGPFDHPIHFGVFCGAIVGLVFYVLGYGQSWPRRVLKTVATLFTASLALSAGPLTAMTSQCSLITWDLVFRRFQGRWWILGGLTALAYVVVDILSNRTPFHVFASYFAFNPQTAYSRINIWIYGTRSIFDHPVFGIGMNDWERLWFMSESVDMFWIQPAMIHGIPVWILYFVLFLSTTVPVVRRGGLDARLSAYRTGYAISMAGFFVSGWTVHFWDMTFVLFIFLLGSGAWLIEAKTTEAPVREPATSTKQRTIL